MSEGEGICAAVAAWLREQGVNAREGWSALDRVRLAAPAAVVTVREYAARPGGFENYLGERYSPEKGVWEELYGKKVEVKLGLDLYGPEVCSEQELQRTAEELVRLLTLGGPEGLQVGEVTCGETVWDEKQRLLRRTMTARCTAWLQAVGHEGAEFLDFELRGGWKI